MALLGVGIYCEVTDVKSPTNETTAVNTTNVKPDLKVSTVKPDLKVPPVKPDLNVPDQSAINITNADIIANKTEEVKQICLGKTGQECVELIFEMSVSANYIPLIIVILCRRALLNLL